MEPKKETIIEVKMEATFINDGWDKGVNAKELEAKLKSLTSADHLRITSMKVFEMDDENEAG